MTSEMWIALMSLLGTAVGSICGILAANKLVNYRLKKLEEKVDKHNCVVERTYKLEGQVTELQHDVKDLKGYHKPN